MPAWITRPAAALLLALALLPGQAAAAPFSNLYLFGDSLSENGNAGLELDAVLPPGAPRLTSTPIGGDAFIPSLPYDRGPALLPAFSNGPVWSERLAVDLGLGPLLPALAGGTNYAFGGARMSAERPSASPSVQGQVDDFLGDVGNNAPADALYVIWGGGNDARDAAVSGDPAAVQDIIGDYGRGLAAAVGDLVLGGARNFVVVNTPDIGLTPAVRSQGAAAAGDASALSDLFNDTYDATMDFLDFQFAGTDVSLLRFDIAGLLRDVVADPAGFGLTDVTGACAADTGCIASPGGHLFWDGIHPTAAGHAIIASAVRARVPEPASLLLATAGLLLVTLGARRGA